MAEHEWPQLAENTPLLNAVKAERERRIRSGEAAREAAQRHFASAPSVLNEILQNKLIPARHRIEAAKELRRWRPLGPDATATAEKFVITIDLGGDKQVRLRGRHHSEVTLRGGGTMVTPFKSIIDEPANTQLEADARSHGDHQPVGDCALVASENVTALRPDISKYLDRAVDVATLPIPLVKFPGVKRVVPAREWTCKGLQELADEIAPTPAPIFARKEDVPYYIAGFLRDAELTNKRLRQERQRMGQSTVGRQRSSAHIGSLGPALLLDDDGDVFARLPVCKCLALPQSSTAHTPMGLQKMAQRSCLPAAGSFCL